jgi:hypothetical protein
MDAHHWASGRSNAMPARATVCWTLCGLTALALLDGCGESVAARQHRQMCGAWYEDPTQLPARGDSLARPAATADRRQLDFNPDGTFNLTVCDPNGQTVVPAQSVSGTWRLSGSVLTLKVRTVSFDAAHARWVPQQCLDLRLGSGPAQPDYLDLRDAAGIRVRYSRTPPASTSAAPPP